MKIIHTADWHIGAELNGVSLEPDFILFRDWLIHTCIPENGVQVLIVSGDIFDKSNPSAQSRMIYFETLRLLLQSGLEQIILTGGNHDSPLTLNAPAELLRQFRISITGGVPENIESLIHPFPPENPQVVFATVPYLRDGDIRQASAAESSASKEESVRHGIKEFFKKIGVLCQPYRDQGIPIISMGHLFATGATTSDSERQIQVGNLGGVDDSVFPEEYFDYVALGHIHRPQKVGKSERIQYSGSPILLSYSENTHAKIVLLLEVEGKGIRTTEIPVPCFRKLIRLKGSYLEVQKKLEKIQVQEALPALVEVRVEEASYNPSTLRELSAWVEASAHARSDLKITRHQFQVLADTQSDNAVVQFSRELEELKPIEVFGALIADKNIEESLREKLTQSFMELVNEVEEGTL